MIRSSLAALTAALVLATPLPVAAQAFEGRLRFRTVQIGVDAAGDLRESLLDVPVAELVQREGAEVTEATVLIKGNLLRSETPETESAYVIWDFERNAALIIQLAERSYMEIVLESDSTAGPGGPALTERALGETRTINGMRATGYEVRGEDFIMRAWMTRDHPDLSSTFSRVMTPMEGEEEDAENAARRSLARRGFPVLILVLTPDGLEVEETVSVERAPVAADLFRVPPGFTKIQVPGEP